MVVLNVLLILLSFQSIDYVELTIRANMNCNVFVAWKDEKSFDQRTINGLGFQPVPGEITSSDERCNLRHIAKKEVQNGETIVLKMKRLGSHFIAVFVK